MTRAILLDRREQQIRNLITNPGYEANPSGTYNGANGATYTKTTASKIGTAGSYGIHVSCPANGVGDSGVGVGAITLVAGHTYTYSFWIRATTADTYNGYVYGGAVSGSARFYATLSAGQVARVSFTRTATANGSGAFYLLRSAANANVVTDFDVDNVMVTEGLTLWDYADGDTPGWHWDGAAGASTSVGFPNTLQRVVGSLSASVVTSNPSVSISATPNPPLARTTPHTALLMYEITGTTTTQQLALARHGGTVIGMTRLRVLTTTTAGQLQLVSIGGNWNYTTGSGTDGSTSSVFLPLTAGAVGKHILAITWNGVLGSGNSFSYNIDGTEGTLLGDAGTGFDDGSSVYSYYQASVSNSGAGYVFTNTNATARIAAVNWLANHYGIVLS